MLDEPPCDLDPSVYNLASAWYRWPLPEGHRCAHLYEPGWVAMHHGVGEVRVMRACGCPLCWERADEFEAAEKRFPSPPPPPAPKPPRVVDVAPVRAHVRRLLEAGMSRERIAVAAQLDRTTIARVLRPSVRQVRADTAEVLLAVEADRPLRAVQ